jgi:hypothetical protein
MKETDLTQEEWESAMDRAAIKGFKLFVLGVLTIGIGPLIYLYWQDRKEAAQPNQEGQQ